jgi:hypothetical protein
MNEGNVKARTEPSGEMPTVSLLDALPDELYLRVVSGLDFRNQKSLAITSRNNRDRTYTASLKGVETVAGLRQKFRTFVEGLFPEAARKLRDFQTNLSKILNVEIDAYFRTCDTALFRKRVLQLVPVLSRKNPAHQPTLDDSALLNFLCEGKKTQQAVSLYSSRVGIAFFSKCVAQQWNPIGLSLHGTVTRKFLEQAKSDESPSTSPSSQKQKAPDSPVSLSPRSP